MNSTFAVPNISFPAIQYFEPGLTRPIVVQKLVKSWPEVVNHGSRWPLRRFWVPGGILDSEGKQFIIQDILNISTMPFFLKPFDALFGSVWYLGRFEAELIISEPKQLTLEDFRDLLARLVGRERSFHAGQGVGYKKYQQLIRKAPTYAAAIVALYGD
jgi:hypothetical protein